MTSTQAPTSRPATTGLGPAASMSTAGNAAASPTTGASGNAPAPTFGGEQQARDPTGGGFTTVSEEQWDSERQIVASLAKLQELEAKVRYLVPLVQIKGWYLLTSILDP